MIDALDHASLVARALDSMPPEGQRGFGRHLGPLVGVVTHERRDGDPAPGEGWSTVTLAPLASCTVSIGASALHYALSVFEGAKALRTIDGRIHLLRPYAHARRLAASAQRLCMPPLPAPVLLEACAETVAAQEALVPAVGTGALYLRPIVTATETFLGVRASRTHRLHVLVSPMDPPRTAPISMWLERRTARAAPGGLGAIKTGANYAAGLFALEDARRRGFDQVLFASNGASTAPYDAVISETASSNVFFVVGKRVLTPPLEDTILAGITRDTCLAQLRARGVEVEERAPTVGELATWHRSGTLREIFCTGTASAVVPVGALHGDAFALDLPAPNGDSLAASLRADLDALFEGRLAPPASLGDPLLVPLDEARRLGRARAS